MIWEGGGFQDFRERAGALETGKPEFGSLLSHLLVQTEAKARSGPLELSESGQAARVRKLSAGKPPRPLEIRVQPPMLLKARSKAC